MLLRTITCNKIRNINRKVLFRVLLVIFRKVFQFLNFLLFGMFYYVDMTYAGHIIEQLDVNGIIALALVQSVIYNLSYRYSFGKYQGTSTCNDGVSSGNRSQSWYINELYNIGHFPVPHQGAVMF